ncbi:MAG TPA: hypothetical protein VHX64_01315, partial [Caulobacteraceae bacterium]|nr:hypothetical protein [Caulobacteraceae bacterium]
ITIHFFSTSAGLSAAVDLVVMVGSVCRLANAKPLVGEGGAIQGRGAPVNVDMTANRRGKSCFIWL